MGLSDVALQSSIEDGDITFAAPVTWTSGNTLTVRSGDRVFVNAPLDGGSATIELFGGQRTTNGSILLRDRVTAGTLRMGFNTQVDSARQIRRIRADAPIAVDTLELDLRDGGITGNVILDHPDNEIGIFRTIGASDVQGRIRVRDGSGDLQVALSLANTASTGIQVVTENNLILRSDHVLSFADQPIDVVFASRSGAFTNNAGADAIPVDAASGQRFFIYSDGESTTELGGLTGTVVLDQTFDANPPDTFPDDNISRIIYATAAALMTLVLRADDFSREYGEPNPAFTFSVSGLEAGDTFEGVTDGAPVFSVSATQSSNAGEYTIAISRGTLTSGEYEFAFQPGTLTITQAPLALGIGDLEKEYGQGGTATSLVPHEITGFKLGQDESDLQNFSILSEGYDRTADAGDYRLFASLTDPNYFLDVVDEGTLSVTPKAITGQIGNLTREYGESSDFGITYTGLVNGDLPTEIDSVDIQAGGGASDRSLAVGNYTVTGMAQDNNYDVTLLPGQLTVTPAPLVLTADSFSRGYGDPNPQFTFSVDGLKNGETAESVVGGVFGTTPADVFSDVGEYAISLSGGNTNGNYTIVERVGGTLTVTPAPLVLRADDFAREYGDSNPAFTFSVEGLKNGETAGSVVSGVSLSTRATPRAGVGGHAINLTGGTATSNYTIVGRRDGVLQVAPAPLVLIATSFERPEGDPNPTFTFSVEGLKLDDSGLVVSGVRLTSDADEDSPSGDYAIVLTGGRAANYTITERRDGTLTVTPAVVIEEPEIEVTHTLDTSKIDPNGTTVVKGDVPDDWCLEGESPEKCSARYREAHGVNLLYPTCAEFGLAGGCLGDVLLADLGRFSETLAALLEDPEILEAYEALPGDIKDLIVRLQGGDNTAAEDLVAAMDENEALRGLMLGALAPYLKSRLASGEPLSLNEQFLLDRIAGHATDFRRRYATEFVNRLEARYDEWADSQRVGLTALTNLNFPDMVAEVEAGMEAWVDEAVAASGIVVAGVALGTAIALKASGVALSTGVVASVLPFAIGSAASIATASFALVAAPVGVVAIAVAGIVAGGMQAFESAGNRKEFEAALAKYRARSMSLGSVAPDDLTNQDFALGFAKMLQQGIEANPGLGSF